MAKLLGTLVKTAEAQAKNRVKKMFQLKSRKELMKAQELDFQEKVRLVIREEQMVTYTYL